MSANTFIKRLTQQERINFLLTNRIPRRYATLFMGWFSRIENPLVCQLSLRIWNKFADELDLTEAEKQQFTSLHDCFIRQLKHGSRPFDNNPDVIISPCDAIVGCFGKIDDTTLYQAKGFPYTLSDLIPDQSMVDRYRNGLYITLRLKSTMYHRFHAPCDCGVNKINYISGDTWNVNPVALQRIEKLYCKNERAVIDLQMQDNNRSITLVPVAAILVASIKLHCLETPLNLKYQGPNLIDCDAHYKKGDEMGYFQHGSTIILFATNTFKINKNIHKGKIIKMGESLLSFD